MIAPEALVIEAWVTTPFGCCGYPPNPSESRQSYKAYNGASAKNQMCTCGELIGWHNSDCLLPELIALSSDDVEALAP